MLSLNVFSERHLQQRQSHVESLDDIALSRQRMVSPGRLSARHLTLEDYKNVLENFRPKYLLKSFKD